ncbi:YcnI family protein [Mycobacterium sp. DSM 3803]|nr:YcnI family protein [Mycobacterium sp. DSM 3803]
MQPHIGAPCRALLGTAATVAAVALLTAAPAAAHVHVDADGAAPGSTAVLTFRVPGESDSGALTTALSVTLPDVTSARTEVMPGWTAKLDRDVAAGTVRSVTWTAAPGVGISPDQFALFKISVKLPDSDTVSFPATQTYSDGSVVHWDQAPLPDGSEPEHPAPEVKLTGAASDDHHGDEHAEQPALAQPTAQPSSSTDDSARWLAGGALVVAAAAVVTALLARRRS